MEHEADNHDKVVFMGNNPYKVLGDEYMEHDDNVLSDADTDKVEPNLAQVLTPIEMQIIKLDLMTKNLESCNQNRRRRNDHRM